MSGIGKWSLGIGVGLLVVAVLCVVLKQVPVGVITGILGLVAVGIAGYDAVYNWLDRANQRRQAARYQRERDARSAGRRPLWTVGSPRIERHNAEMVADALEHGTDVAGAARRSSTTADPLDLKENVGVMAILGTFEEDDYRPESGTLVVRDDGAYERRGPFGRHGSKAQPCGTIVRTGNGWLEGAAGPGPDVVRMEVHDAVPEDDTADWEDAVDIPYRSLSGTVGLDYATGGSGGDGFALAGADAYRVRVTRRRVDEGARGDRWLLRFWSAEPAPPRWLKRRETAVRPAEPGWDNLFSHEFGVLLRAVAETQEELGGATIESLRQWFVRRGRGDWLDHSVRDRVPVLMHPSDFARQLGMPEPDTLADTLDVFVAVGALVEEGGSYRKPAVQPNPEDVIDMSDRYRDRIVWQRDHDRFCDYAADLVSVALWNGSTQTLAGLADRTLVPETDVRATLDWAERQNLLRVTGSLDATFTMTP